MLVAAGLDRALRPDLQPAAPRRRRRPVGQRLRADGADRGGRADDDRQHRHLHRGAVAGRARRRAASTPRPRPSTSSWSGSTAWPRSCSPASIALGEILVANRRFLFYALAPILYSAGIIVFTVLFAGRYGIVATAWGAVAGAAAHLAIRAIGTTRTSFRIRPGFAVRTAAFAEFLRLMFPRMFSVAIEPLTITYFTRVASGARRRRGVVAQLRARLPGPAGQPDRRRLLAGGLPGALDGVRRRRRPAASARSSAGTS